MCPVFPDTREPGHAHKHEQNIQYFPESTGETVYAQHNMTSKLKKKDKVLGFLTLASTYKLFPGYYKQHNN